MAQVPYQPFPDVTPEDRTTYAPQLNVRVDPNAFGANIGRAVEGLGAGLERASGELFNRALAMQQLRNEQDKTNAISSMELEAGKREVDYNSLRGKNAVEGYEQYQNDVQAIRQKWRDSLTNPAAQRMYDAEGLAIQRRLILSGASHAATQNWDASRLADQARIDSAISTLRYGMNPNDQKGQFDTVEATANKMADDMGMDADARASFVWKWKSAAKAHLIEDVARNHPIEAKQMLLDSLDKRELHSQDIDKVWSFVDGHLNTTGSQTIARRALDTYKDPEGFLAARGAPRTQGLDPVFGQRIVAAIQAAEQATGEKAVVRSGTRTSEEQEVLYERHLRGGPLAAPPGTSRHEFGQAVDLAPGPVLDWVRAHVGQYGLGILTGPRSKFDTVHIQLDRDNKGPIKVRADMLPEREILASAGAEADRVAPNDDAFKERVQLATQARINKERALQRDEDNQNVSTIQDILNRPDPPRTTEDLVAIPEARQAYFSLSPITQRAIDRRLAAPPPGDPAEFQRLWGMAHSGDDQDRQDFLKEDIQNNRNLSTAHWAQLVKLQDTVRKGGERDVKASGAMSILRQEGIMTEDQWQDKQLRPMVTGAISNAIAEYEKNYAKYPDRDTIKKMGQYILKEQAAVPPPYDSSKWQYGNFDLRNLGNLPWWLMHGGQSVTDLEKSREKIIKQWSAVNKGVPPTEEQIRQVYNANLFKDLFGKGMAKKPPPGAEEEAPKVPMSR